MNLDRREFLGAALAVGGVLAFPRALRAAPVGAPRRTLVLLHLVGGNDGLNTVVPYEQLEAETVQWCREMLAMSPIALRCLKAALNADCDGQAGLQELAGNATLLFYLTEEGQEGRNAYVEKRRPDFRRFPRLP